MNAVKSNKIKVVVDDQGKSKTGKGGVMYKCLCCGMSAKRKAIKKGHNWGESIWETDCPVCGRYRYCWHVQNQVEKDSSVAKAFRKKIKETKKGKRHFFLDISKKTKTDNGWDVYHYKNGRFVGPGDYWTE